MFIQQKILAEAFAWLDTMRFGAIRSRHVRALRECANSADTVD